VKVPGFEGPLDLLVQLAHQGKVDLTDVSLSELANEFLTKTKGALDLNEATEALWMLATLVEMKAKALLPKPAPIEAPPETAATLAALFSGMAQLFQAAAPVKTGGNPDGRQ